MMNPEPRRILVVWPEYPPAIGGMQVHGAAFVRHALALGHDVWVVANVPPPSRADAAREHDAAAGISIRRILSRSDFQNSSAELQFLVKELRPDAVFSSQIAYAPACREAPIVVCRSAGNDVLRPWVGPAEVSQSAMRHLPLAEQRRRMRQNREFVLQAAQSCDAVLCNSEWTARELSRRGVPRAQVVRGGVDMHLFKPLDRARYRCYLGLPPSTALVGLAARHVAKKGIDIALHALTRLADLDLRLLIAGIGPETPMLVALADELDVNGRVRFLGSIDHAQMPHFLGICDLVLAPSRTVYDPRKFALDHETMGRIACEAAACGVPIVASRTGGLPELIEDGRTGILTRENDADALADAIRMLIENPQLAARMGSAARIHCQQSLSFADVHEATLKFLCSSESQATMARSA